jgi:hypothetical protein
MTVRTLCFVTLLLVGCAKESPPVSAAPPVAAPPPALSALPASSDAGDVPTVGTGGQLPPRELVADAGTGAARSVQPSSPSGSGSGFRAPPTTDGDAGAPVGPRRPSGPVPTMDKDRRAKPPPLNPRTAPPPGPFLPPGPSHAADAGAAGPAVQ